MDEIHIPDVIDRNTVRCSNPLVHISAYTKGAGFCSSKIKSSGGKEGGNDRSEYISDHCISDRVLRMGIPQQKDGPGYHSFDRGLSVSGLRVNSLV